MVQPVVLKKKRCLKGLTLFARDQESKGRAFSDCVEKRTETMQLRDIAKAVVDITGETMDELLELAGKLCILDRLALVIF